MLAANSWVLQLGQSMLQAAQIDDGLSTWPKAKIFYRSLCLGGSIDESVHCGPIRPAPFRTSTTHHRLRYRAATISAS